MFLLSLVSFVVLVQSEPFVKNKSSADLMHKGAFVKCKID